MCLAYLVLLSASHTVRWRARVAARAAVGTVEPSGGASLAEKPGGSLPILVLLHGSPGSSRDFDGISGHLAERFELRAPDLLGFGDNRARVDDYSIRAQAEYVEGLLDGLGPVHLVGFSLGGGVALELVERAPERVRSLVLLSSIGRQEFELLGHYSINHALHGIQWLALTALHEGVPHFGWLDRFPLDHGYARSFYDTDQRPLAEIAARLEQPVLVIHGRHDPLVPYAAAVEHHRTIPQAELITLDSDHFDLFRQPEHLASEVARFIERVERGEAKHRSQASGDRVAAAAEPFDPSSLEPVEGLGRWIWIALLAVATLVSEDLTTISSGLLVAQGRIGFATAAGACFLGILVGDVLLFWAGRWLGRPWLRRRPLRWFLSARRVEEASEWFRRRGAVVIFLSRFMPGMRLPSYVAAGMLDTSFWRFLLYFAIAVVVWTPLLVWVSFRFGAAFEGLAASPAASPLASPVLFLLVVAVLWLALATVRHLASAPARRRARWWFATLHRRWRWEFWPIQLFYTPVVGYVLWLGLKHRSLTLFTAANPAMPAGGFVGESKGDILDRLPGDRVAPYLRLPGSLDRPSRRHRIDDFVSEHGFPVVLKPDVGQRGRGVSILRDMDAIDDYLASFSDDLIVQVFVDGPELGVFYVRFPDEPRGRIFSVTEKLLPVVIGDGESSLEELIYRGERTSPRARLLLERAGPRRATIPAAGERVTLVELGTHCRGAIFDDGSRFLTPELEAAVDDMSRSYEGFHFGRYDLRAPSAEAFREGRDLKVLELNGVTSEATHIYDPRYGLLDAYRILFDQWRLAFAVGAAQHKAGARPSSIGELVRLLREPLRRG